MTTSFHPTYAMSGEVAAPVAPAPSDAIDYWAFALALWRGKYLIVAAGLATAIAMVAASLAVTPTFTAKTKILLTTRQAQVINITNVVENPEYTDTAILSELTIIPSPANLLETARRLKLADVPEFNPDLRPPDLLGDAINVVRSGIRNLLNPTSESVDEATPDQIAAGILARHVRVMQLGASYILEIEADSKFPRLAAAIANTLADVYIGGQINEKLAANQRAVDWLSDTESSLRLRLQEAEREFELKRVEVFPEEALSLEVLGQQRGALTGALVAADADRAAAAVRATHFDALAAQGDLGAAMQFATSPTLAALVEKREAARQQRLSLERRAESRAADIAQLDIAVREFDSLISDEIAQLSLSLAAQIVGAEERKRALYDQIIALERKMLEANVQNLDLYSAERELAAKRAVYNQILSRLTETRERGELQDPDARVVAAAWRPPAPSAPKRPLLAVVGLILGCGLSSAWILLREARREVFRTSDEAQAKTGAPVIAALPEGLVRLRGSWMSDPPVEAAGALRRMLMLIDAGRREGSARMLLATSVLPGEGAPEFCVALARICVEDGQRVAIVDCLPTREDALKFAAAARETDAVEPKALGFRVLRPVKPVGGARRRPFVDELRDSVAGLLDEYDRVILCAPPVLAASGVLAIGRHVDAAILAFRWESTPQGAVIDALTDLRTIGAPIAGLVMVETDFTAAAAYGYAGADVVGRKVRAFATTV